MRLTALLMIVLALVAAPAAARGHRSHPATHRGPTIPVVVELYTAQGCADCPQANELLMKLAEEPGVIALTFPVDYWDYLGWRDTFAKPEFSDRQRAYMKALKLRDVYTPQIVVDGRRQLAGVKPDEVEAAVRDAQRDPGVRPEIAPSGKTHVQIGSGRVTSGGATVWLVRYAADVRDVEVKKGENKGRTVHHGDLVRELVKVGFWAGHPVSLRVPKAGEPGLKTVILIQSVRTGRILAARRL
jgi:hypothetical protein